MKIPSNCNLFLDIFFMKYFGIALLVYRDLLTVQWSEELLANISRRDCAGRNV